MPQGNIFINDKKLLEIEDTPCKRRRDEPFVVPKKYYS